MPSRRAAASLSPPVSRSARKMARRSSSSRGSSSSASERFLVGRPVLQVRGQIADVQDGPEPKRHGALDGVFQFAHVAGPVVGHQAAHGVFGDGAHGPLRIAELFEEGADQQRNIALALAQRRQFDLHHVQPEEEVLAEPAGADGRFQVAIGGGDDAHVECARVRWRPPAEFALLQHAQQLGLQIHGQVANFVEEDGAAVGRFEQSRLASAARR